MAHNGIGDVSKSSGHTVYSNVSSGRSEIQPLDLRKESQGHFGQQTFPKNCVLDNVNSAFIVGIGASSCRPQSVSKT